MSRKHVLSILFALAIATVAVFGGAAPAAAAPSSTFNVNSTLDEPDASPGSGGCSSTPSGVCTLRAAIMEANFTAAADTIVLPASAQVYQLTRAGLEDAALNGDLDITHSVTITGGGAANTIIDGGDLDRIFQITTASVVTISGVTIRNGRNVSSGGSGIYMNNLATLTLNDSVVTANETQFGDGAGILSYGTLTLNRVVVSNNIGTSMDTEGGGLYAAGTTVVNDSLFTSNVSTAGAGGGGIYNTSNLTLNNTTVMSNTANSAYSAGGIENFYGTLTLNYSTVSNNQAISQYADAGGIVNLNGTVLLNFSTVSGNQATHQYTTGAGGIYSYNDQGGSTTLVDSTVSGNSTRNYGGGLTVDASGIVYLQNSTIAFNRADSDDSDDIYAYAHGGGINNAGTVYLRNTLMAGNVDGVPGDEDADDCYGTLTSEGYNLFSTTDACTLSGDTTGNQTVADPDLSPLGFHGGPTQTHALLNGSEAIDTGNPTACTRTDASTITTDQRAFARTVDGDGVGGARCDIGAFEYSTAFYQLFVPLAIK